MVNSFNYYPVQTRIAITSGSPRNSCLPRKQLCDYDSSLDFNPVRSPPVLLFMFVVISTSLNPGSRSRILANYAHDLLQTRAGDNCRLIDLAEMVLPPCDANDCYSDPNVIEVSNAIRAAQGILIATPIYNYNVSSSAKNLVELTGKVWTEKVVGFLCAAGGNGSYMGCLGLANSLMLDFRTLILPRFVYTTGDSFADDKISETQVEDRIVSLIEQLMAVSAATMPPNL